MPQWKKAVIQGLKTNNWTDEKWSLQNLEEPQWKKAVIQGLTTNNWTDEKWSLQNLSSPWIDAAVAAYK